MQCTFDSKARQLFCFSLLLGLFLPSVLFSQQYVTNSSQSGVYETLGDSATVSPAPIYTPDQVPISTPEQLSGDSAHNCENCEDCKKKQEAAEKLKKQIGSAHKNTFFDNDFSYLNDPNYCGWNLGDAFKSFTGPRCAKLSIGGQYRARSHHERNMRGLGLTGVDDDFLLGRTRIYGDLRLNQNIRVFGEMIDADSYYENFAPRPIEENRFDMLNLFVDARLINGPNGEATARIGRQEVNLGAQRLVSSLDWANTRRNFEGVRVSMKRDALTLDGFWLQPMRIDNRSFDAPDRDQEFMGLYSSYKSSENRTVDTYFIRYLNGAGTNDFEYNTVGMRVAGNQGAKLYDFEGAYQFGDNTDGSSHVAGMMTFGLGRKFDCHCWKPTLWIYYDWASGDDATGAGNGFHHLFPLAHKYNGFMDLFGRRNLEDVNVQYSVNPSKKLKLLAWYHYLFLETQTDTPYSVVMTPFNGGVLPGSADLGHEIDLIADYKINARQSLLLGYSHFFSGEYYSTTPGVPFDGDADFFYTQWTMNF